MHEREERREQCLEAGPVAEATGSDVPSTWGHPTRREFLGGALTLSGLAWSGLLDPERAHASVPCAAVEPPADPLRIGELVSENGRLRAVITIRSGPRKLPGPTGPTLPMRYLAGKYPQGAEVWPPPPPEGEAPPPLPGPTLRARVGDQVELTFLNHVDVEDFSGFLDRVERGVDEGCQRVVSPQGTELYPGTTPRTANDHAPNCFHGSSTSNLHFHGTHVTPDGLGDNVLLQLRPDRTVTEASVQADFDLIFRAGPPREWCDLPRSWRERQLQLLREYDETAPWQGNNPTPGNPVLPEAMRLLPPTLELIRQGRWPQYQIGAYPYCFRLTEYTTDAQNRPTGPMMGQAPGTHWYHAHKHGSTAINVLNGMAGAFIIEGEYDDTLKCLYPGLVQHVLVVQNFAEVPALMRAGSGAGPSQTLFVNGRQNPTITMRPGEVQLWRLVNASVRAVTTLRDFVPKSGSPQGPAPEMKQIAQDGVQFCWENFDKQPRLRVPETDPARRNAFATGNRIDLLVKAPAAAGSWELRVKDIDNVDRLLLTVEVNGAAASMDFPTHTQYPRFPGFLSDIDAGKIRIFRQLDFGWRDGRSEPELRVNGSAPQFTINEEQFEGGRYDQTMVLDDAEEWKLLNTTARIAHPFHIHVNPFQVVEIYDPNNATNKHYQPEKNYIWQDVVAIPPARFVDDKMVEPGFVRIRHRFVDFPGSFVLHCHMLAHEDRGMMQLVRVISARDAVPHH